MRSSTSRASAGKSAIAISSTGGANVRAATATQWSANRNAATVARDRVHGIRIGMLPVYCSTPASEADLFELGRGVGCANADVQLAQLLLGNGRRRIDEQVLA